MLVLNDCGVASELLEKIESLLQLFNQKNATKRQRFLFIFIHYFLIFQASD